MDHLHLLHYALQRGFALIMLAHPIFISLILAITLFEWYVIQWGTYFGSPRTQGNIYTIAGSGPYGSPGSYAGSSVAATSDSAKLKSPAGICIDRAGNLYIADSSNNRIRMVYNSGSVFGGSSYTR